jgi:hypothetical protein
MIARQEGHRKMKEASIGYRAVMAVERTYELLAIAACVELADELGPEQPLAGEWILDRTRVRIPDYWIPNFKPFVKKGVLTRVSGSRGGKRAYYLMVDRDGSKLALVERGVLRN